MQGLWLVVLLAAAASSQHTPAYPIDQHFYRCIPYLSDHGSVFHEQTFLCDSYNGLRYLVASDEPVSSRYIRSFIPGLFGGGLGGAGSASAAQSSAHNVGIGLGPLSFNANAAQSSAGSVAGGGGLGGFLG